MMYVRQPRFQKTNHNVTAENRTQISCLEGSYTNHYPTIICPQVSFLQILWLSLEGLTKSIQGCNMWSEFHRVAHQTYIPKKWLTHCTWDTTSDKDIFQQSNVALWTNLAFSCLKARLQWSINNDLHFLLLLIKKFIQPVKQESNRVAPKGVQPPPQVS